MFHILLLLTIVLAWFLSLSKAVMSWNLVWEKGPQVDRWNQTTLNWATFSHNFAIPDCLELISATTLAVHSLMLSTLHSCQDESPV
jgi:hypothetical protein